MHPFARSLASTPPIRALGAMPVLTFTTPASVPALPLPPGVNAPIDLEKTLLSAAQDVASRPFTVDEKKLLLGAATALADGELSADEASSLAINGVAKGAGAVCAIGGAGLSSLCEFAGATFAGALVNAFGGDASKSGWFAHPVGSTDEVDPGWLASASGQAYYKSRGILNSLLPRVATNPAAQQKIAQIINEFFLQGPYENLQPAFNRRDTWKQAPYCSGFHISEIASWPEGSNYIPDVLQCLYEKTQGRIDARKLSYPLTYDLLTGKILDQNERAKAVREQLYPLIEAELNAQIEGVLAAAAASVAAPIVQATDRVKKGLEQRYVAPCADAACRQAMQQRVDMATKDLMGLVVGGKTQEIPEALAAQEQVLQKELPASTGSASEGMGTGAKVVLALLALGALYAGVRYAKKR
jgi:hypothetical protein